MEGFRDVGKLAGCVAGVWSCNLKDILKALKAPGRRGGRGVCRLLAGGVAGLFGEPPGFGSVFVKHWLQNAS